ncbi:hypothetical protein RBB77_23335 (plasmid) [Tunturibacter psychrotolerans]|uniref:Uncharacterized protein n=1 Tax=Tunturiibacter psychrotolerans TaxID=3069686 RepID=A0AAU7ZXA7_9BACT
MDERELTLENKKLDLQAKGLRLEQSKARWTAATVIISVVSAAGSIAYNAWSAHETAQDQFATKLVEITFANDHADVGIQKANAMAYLLGKRLPSDLREKMSDPESFRKELAKRFVAPSGVLLSGDISSDEQKDLLRMYVAANPKDRQTVVKSWKAMFPPDQMWVDAFVSNLQKPEQQK